MNIPKRAEHPPHRRMRSWDSIDLSPALVVALEHVAAGAGLSDAHLVKLIAHRFVLLEAGAPTLTPLGERQLKRSRRKLESSVDVIGLVLADYVERYQQDLSTSPKRAETRFPRKFLVEAKELEQIDRGRSCAASS